MSCTFTATDQPRMLLGRHRTDCPGDCTGCQPCTEAHCGTCGIRHVDQVTCPECIAAARETLTEIGRMCATLPEEAEAKGIESEAMNLLGPATDPERRGHTEAAYLAGRLPEGWLDTTHGKECPTLRNEPCAGCAGSELHPLLVLGSDLLEWQAELEHDDDARITVTHALGYLERNLGYMAQWPHIDFRVTVKRWRQCASHLEAVLHDGEQRDTGAPCLGCRTPQERVWGDDEHADGWMCPRCRTRSTEAQYRFAVAQLHRDEAEWLTDREMEIRTGVKAGTIREWSRRDHVAKRLDSGRVVYRVEDVEARIA